MSHPGSWQRNPRKMALEVERQRAREREMEAYGGASLTPADTRALGWTEVFVGCPKWQRMVSFAKPLPARVASLPWREIGRRMRCEHCGSRPDVIRLSKIARPVGGAPRSVTMATVEIG